ncbi:uncharacterized protein JNUCC1_03537 [Lentibacillus sp. JNUCC-1]|uniref:YqzE family protein n=1 Tax=Lentibacillus sp. JNUCC-1 TaxID=2654513 RepID=UPI0012E925D3|nr:YqzE family protein [Lentibacillus sp. JNUCC-1]MUV39653.1 uncharacterized protein [Lentibacillus sp. JNUCC-1]
MSINDYVKFLTETLTSYIDQPKEDRKQHKKDKAEPRSALSDRWFGVLPFAMKLFRKR